DARSSGSGTAAVPAALMRARTPAVQLLSFLLGRGALRVEALDVAAFGAGGRVDDGVDQGRFFGGERLGERVREAWRVGAVIAPAAERLDDPLVTRIAQEAGRRIGPALGIAAIDAVIVEDDGRHRQVVTADRLDLHAAEAKGAVALDRDDGLARYRGGADRVAHADPHDAPGTAVEAMARHVHIDDVAAEIERVGALVDDVDIGMRGKRVADGAQGGRKIHRAGIGVEARRHALDVLLLALADLVDPGGLAPDLTGLQRGVEGREGGFDVGRDGCGDRTVAVELGRRDVDLHDLRVLVPQWRPAMRQEPIETRADDHHDIGIADRIGTR